MPSRRNGKLEELQLHNEYQLRLKDMSSSEKLKEVGEKYQQDREAERMRYQLLGEEKEEVADECEQRIGRMEDTHRHALQELENAYQQKIMLEVERYGQLEKEREMSSAGTSVDRPTGEPHGVCFRVTTGL